MQTPVTTEPAARATPPAPDLADLKRKSVRGGVITFVSQGANVVIQLASTVILARLLTPQDYGVIAMVAAVTAFAGLFRDLGLSAAAIQQQTLTHAQQSNLFWINVAMGAALTVLLSVASPLVAWFYGRPELQCVTVALSVNFLIGSLATQSGALLVREMRFGRQALAGICGALVSLGVSVVLALKAFRYWALVWGQLIGGLASTMLLFWLSPFRPGLPSRGTGLKSMLRFGAHITAFDIINYFHRNLDKILIGRVWGAEALGLYSRAYALLMFPIANLRGPINAVAFPAMSRLQNDPNALRKYFLETASLIASLTMPFVAFLFVASDLIIQVLLGPQWSGASPIFSFLAIAAFIQPVSGFVGALLLSLGQSSTYLGCGFLNTIVFLICVIVGVHWNAHGVAVAYAIGNYVVLYPWFKWAFRNTPISPKAFIQHCGLPFGMSVVGTLLAVALRQSIRNINVIFQLLVAASPFVLCLSVCILLAHRQSVVRIVGRLRDPLQHD